MALETPSRPPAPPFMANAILNFHFDYLTPSLRMNVAPEASLVHSVVRMVRVVNRHWSSSHPMWYSYIKCTPFLYQKLIF